jgi:hypothetical protein
MDDIGSKDFNFGMTGLIVIGVIALALAIFA